jgi:hypothetical protein
VAWLQVEQTPIPSARWPIEDGGFRAQPYNLSFQQPIIVIRREYLRNVCIEACFHLQCLTTIGSQPLWAFRFALYAKRLDGSKCRDCDTKQIISSTARAVTPAY